jgi:hypothetical protein
LFVPPEGAEPLLYFLLTEASEAAVVVVYGNLPVAEGPRSRCVKRRDVSCVHIFEIDFEMEGALLWRETESVALALNEALFKACEGSDPQIQNFEEAFSILLMGCLRLLLVADVLP